AVAAGAIVAIGHGSLIGAAERAVKPNIDLAAGVIVGIEAPLHRGPGLPRQVAPADLRSNHHRRPSARRAGGHLREETHALAEWPRLDLEEGAFGLRARPLKAGPSRVPHSGERSSEQFPPRCRRTVSLF